MRLYLSSYKIGNKSSELPLLVGPNKHVALIPNALDVYEDSQRKTDSINENIQSIVDLGFSAEVLDLRKYFNKNKELETELKKYGMVWVRGGDAFVLRKAMRQSGFDKIIIDMLKKDEIVYGACAIDDNGTGLYTTGIGHGDAMHLGQTGVQHVGQDGQRRPVAFLQAHNLAGAQVDGGINGEGGMVIHQILKKFSNTFWPTRWLFSGWNWTPKTLSCSNAAM